MPRNTETQSDLTKSDLLEMAKSNNPDERKRGWALYQAWCKAGPSLSNEDRLTHTERFIISQVFAKKGFK